MEPGILESAIDAGHFLLVAVKFAGVVVAGSVSHDILGDSLRYFVTLDYSAVLGSLFSIKQRSRGRSLTPMFL